jgi:REP element-mobilizing transposase RayT
MTPMLHGFHGIFSTYGFWLPNDPRGSWSESVRCWELARFGPATKVTTRRSVAAVDHDHELRRAAKLALQYPEVHLTGRQARAAAIGFRAATEEASYLVYACSILPQHVHLVLGPHRRNIRRIIGHFRARATQQLSHDHLHPLAGFTQADGTVPSPWGRGSWIVYLYSEEHLRRAIDYVERNPRKEGKPRQHWSFVTPYKGGASPAAK